MKQTITPILFTSGALCIAVIMLGLVAGADQKSAFHFFREWGFIIPSLLVGLVLIAFGVVTMLQVKNELARQSAQPQPPR